MRMRLIIGGAIAVIAAAAVPALAAPAQSTAQVPPACVVVTGPNGLSLQVGLAPNGPSGCTTLP